MPAGVSTSRKFEFPSAMSFTMLKENNISKSDLNRPLKINFQTSPFFKINSIRCSSKWHGRARFGYGGRSVGSIPKCISIEQSSQIAAFVTSTRRSINEFTVNRESRRNELVRAKGWWWFWGRWLGWPAGSKYTRSGTIESVQCRCTHLMFNGPK